MNVISRKKLRDFYEAKPERRQHAMAFEEWFKIARKAQWQNYQEAKATFGQTDVAVNCDIVFGLEWNAVVVIIIMSYKGSKLAAVKRQGELRGRRELLMWWFVVFLLYVSFLDIIVKSTSESAPPKSDAALRATLSD